MEQKLVFFPTGKRQWPGLRAGLQRLFVACALCLTAAAGSALAQDTAQPPPAEVPSAKDGKSLLLFVPQYRGTASARRDALNADLTASLDEVLLQRFDILRFSPSQPVIKRALSEHTISSADLLEPATAETLQRVARAVGARYILTFGAALSGSTMKTDMSFWEQAAGQQGWLTRIAEQITTEAASGKRHLKSTELAALATDAIAARMNVPSSQAEKLHFKPIILQRGETTRAEKPKKKEKETRVAEAKGKTADAAGATGPDAQQPPDKQTVEQGRSASVDDANPLVTAKPTHKKPTIKKVDRPTRDKEPPAAFTTDNTRTTAAPPSIALPNPQAEVKPDMEATAARFRQTGDMANVIVALRRAVNERPHDVGLRRQLVQAYKERKLYDAALAEASRAMQLNPTDSNLHRLYGDALLAHGDMPGALKAYREAMAIDPNDVVSQSSLGDALLADNQYAEALTVYNTAAKADPKSALPHRRLALALAGRAEADAAQYTASLNEIQQARALTAPTDIETYQEDYIALMRLMDARLRGMIDQIQNTYMAQVTGKRTVADVKRLADALKLRAEAAVDYLEKLPFAAGQDTTHLQYQQGAAFVLQAIDLYRDFLTKGDTDNLKDQMQGAQGDALHALNAAAKRLNSKPVVQGAGV